MRGLIFDKCTDDQKVKTDREKFNGPGEKILIKVRSDLDLWLFGSLWKVKSHIYLEKRAPWSSKYLDCQKVLPWSLIRDRDQEKSERPILIFDEKWAWSLKSSLKSATILNSANATLKINNFNISAISTSFKNTTNIFKKCALIF